MSYTRKLPSIPCWKLKHPKQALLEKSRDVATFNRGYRMQAIDPGALKFPSWKKCYQRGLILSELWRRHLPAYIGVDLSTPIRPGNAIVAVGLDPPTGIRYPLEVRFGNWTSPDTARILAEVCRNHNVQFIQVENNAYQQALIDWVRKGKEDFPYWMKIEAYTTGAVTHRDEFAGLPALEVEFHNGAWAVPSAEFEDHPPTCLCDWCRLDNEISQFPTAAQRDGVMAIFFARDALNKWSVSPGASRGLGRLNIR